MLPKVRHTKRGTRAGGSVRNEVLKDVHSRIRGNAAHNLHGTSATALMIDMAKYCECSTVEENRADHVVPRQSITRKQLLGIFPQRVELEKVPTRQINRTTGEITETTDNRAKWRSDRTLLRRGNPFANNGVFKREGSVSVGLNTRKYTAIVPGEGPITDEILGPALDGVSFDDK